MNIQIKYTKETLRKIEKIAGSKLTLSRLIWAVRQERETSQTEFAEMLDMSKSQLCDIEHGRKSISPKLAAEYARKLGYPEDQFVRLCLQEMVDKAKLNMIIEIRLNSRRNNGFEFALAA
jgi:transcriptional regulator with XRE-family HTH domain